MKSATFDVHNDDFNKESSSNARQKVGLNVSLSDRPNKLINRNKDLALFLQINTIFA